MDWTANVPWFPTVWSWTLALLAIWGVAMVPAYVAHRVLSRFRERCGRLAEHMSDRVTRRVNASTDATDKALQEFRDGRLARLVDGGAEAWKQALATVLDPLGKLAESCKTVEESVGKARADAAGAVTTLRAIDVQSWPQVDSIPSAGELRQETARRRVAAFLIAVTSIGSIVAISANTGMLNQILIDLDLAPRTYQLFGFPITLFLAVLLTIVEILTGVAHAAFLHYWRSPAGKLGAMAWLLVPMAIALVEGNFYAQIAGQNSQDISEVPFVGISLRYRDYFFLWGVILVTVLYGIGHLWVHGAIVMMESGGVGRLRKQLRGLATDAETLTEAARKTRAVIAEISDIDLVPLQNEITMAVNGVTTKIESWAGAPPAWATPKAIRLTQAEVRRLQNRVTFWLVLVTLVMAAALAGGSGAVVSVSGLSWPAAVFAVTVLSAMCLAVGVMLGPRELVVAHVDSSLESDEGAAEPAAVTMMAITGSKLTQAVAIALASLAGGAFFVGALLFAKTARDVFALTTAFLPAATLILAGRQLSEYNELTGVYLAAARRRIVDSAGLLVLAVLRFAQFLLALADWVMELLGIPVDMVVGALSSSGAGRTDREGKGF